ncbi:hypothetical protein [Microvirga sp. CF3016]|uniref:hypothetical protein n=1 Tax=Microvirga sp. CF3016 TaxID=3110181 RepID=UPI002E786263|nr:hypothetical protein [Microvirga sp. CF3016]MEE1610493.1 hypothetical protein [Microvirga sp. CF3016]
MSGFYASSLPLVVGILLFGIFVFLVPLLSASTVYRAATLFAALHSGVVTTVIFLDIWAMELQFEWEDITKYLLIKLPNFYLVSLVIGAIFIPKYVLSASTHRKAIISGLLIVILHYFSILLTPGITRFVTHVYIWGSPSTNFLKEYSMAMAKSILYFDPYLTTLAIVSALVAMVATTAIVQKSDDLDP